MDSDSIDLDNEIARRTAVLVDSSDDEAAVTPINDEDNDDFNPDLQEIFSRYAIVERRHRLGRRFSVVIRRGGIRRSLTHRLDNEIGDRLFEADTEIALRISMDTYKPTVETVTEDIINKHCPVIKARHQKDKCTVCQENVKRHEDIRMLPCGHYLHDKCMIGWYTNGNAVCPVCRDKTFSNKKRKR